jgi:hypothetical protein
MPPVGADKPVDSIDMTERTRVSEPPTPCEERVDEECPSNDNGNLAAGTSANAPGDAAASVSADEAAPTVGSTGRTHALHRGAKQGSSKSKSRLPAPVPSVMGSAAAPAAAQPGTVARAIASDFDAAALEAQMGRMISIVETLEKLNVKAIPSLGEQIKHAITEQQRSIPAMIQASQEPLFGETMFMWRVHAR